MHPRDVPLVPLQVTFRAQGRFYWGHHPTSLIGLRQGTWRDVSEPREPRTTGGRDALHAGDGGYGVLAALHASPSSGTTSRSTKRSMSSRLKVGKGICSAYPTSRSRPARVSSMVVTG